MSNKETRPINLSEVASLWSFRWTGKDTFSGDGRFIGEAVEDHLRAELGNHDGTYTVAVMPSVIEQQQCQLTVDITNNTNPSRPDNSSSDYRQLVVITSDPDNPGRLKGQLDLTRTKTNGKETELAKIVNGILIQPDTSILRCFQQQWRGKGIEISQVDTQIFGRYLAMLVFGKPISSTNGRY